MLIKFVAEDKARHCLFFLAKMTHPIKKILPPQIHEYCFRVSALVGSSSL